MSGLGENVHKRCEVTWNFQFRCPEGKPCGLMHLENEKTLNFHGFGWSRNNTMIASHDYSGAGLLSRTQRVDGAWAGGQGGG